jgi:hypothetical protein
MISVIRDNNPVLYLESKYLYRRIEVPGPLSLDPVPIGSAKVVREGTRVSLLTYSVGVHQGLEAAGQFAAEGISVEVVDLRTLVPLDVETIAASVNKTSRAVVLHEDARRLGYGAEIAATGVLLEIMVPEGETVGVGAALARIGAPATRSASAAAAAAAPAPSVPAAALAGNGAGRPLLSPIVRQLAARHGIDLATVQGSGVTGRIMREDIEAAIARATSTPLVTVAPSAPAVTLCPRDEAQPLSRMRLAIGERMVESLRIAPHVWTSVEVDMQAVEEVRRRRKEQFRREEGTSLTYLAFVARATCDALRAFPVVNSSVDMLAKTRVLHHYVNLGIAVDLSEQGLIVPVISDALQDRDWEAELG